MKRRAASSGKTPPASFRTTAITAQIATALELATQLDVSSWFTAGGMATSASRGSGGPAARRCFGCPSPTLWGGLGLYPLPSLAIDPRLRRGHSALEPSVGR